MATKKRKATQVLEKKIAEIKARQEKGKSPNLDLDWADKLTIEKEIGRPLSRQEEFTLRLDREGDRGASYDRLRDWRPPLAPDPELAKPFGAELAEARKRAEEAKVSRMTDEERDVFTIEKAQAEILAKQQAESDHATWLAEPKIKSIVERLEALDTDTALDPSWEWGDTVAIAKARECFATVGVDRTVALQLASDAFAIQTRKRLAAMSEQEKEVERLRVELELQKAEIAELEQATAELPPATSVKEVPKLDPEEEAWQRLEADNSPENLAALMTVITESKATASE